MTIEELDALPIGTVVKAHWPDGSQADYHSVRVPKGHASVQGWALSGGAFWVRQAFWKAILTVVFNPEEQK